MAASFPLPAGRRQWRLSVLLLLALLLVTGMSLSMSRPFGQREVDVDERVLPSLRLVHEMTTALDESRGLAALHLLHADPSEQRGLEGRLQASRLRIERRLAASHQRLADDTEREHFQRVRGRLVDYWSAQDRLLAASRRAAGEPQAAEQARALLSGESQQAFQQLRAELEAWWAYTDQLAERATRLGASQAGTRYLLLVLQALLILALAAFALRWPRLAPQLVSADKPGGPALGQLALQAHLLSLDAAVIAARSGSLGQPPAAVGREMLQIAERLEATAVELQALAGSQPPAPTDPLR